jgi:hypothetical protein
MGKRKANRTDHDIPPGYPDISTACQIVDNAFRMRGDNPRLAFQVKGGLLLRSPAELRIINAIRFWASKQVAAIKKIDDYSTSARALFAEISENLGPENAVRIFQRAMKRRKGKSYDPFIESPRRPVAPPKISSVLGCVPMRPRVVSLRQTGPAPGWAFLSC